VIASNEVYCWGYGSQGQLGNGSTVQYNTRAKKVSKASDNANSALPAGATLASLMSAYQTTCVLASGSGVYCWGVGDGGEVGNGTTASSNLYPVKVSTTTDNPSSALPGDTTVSGLASNGIGTLCVTTADYQAYCWGNGASGQMGDGTNQSLNTLPVKVGQDSLVAVVLDANGTPAACSNVVIAVGGGSLTCTTTAHAEGLVSVTVSNSWQTAVLPAAWDSSGQHGPSNIVSGFYYGTLDEPSLPLPLPLPPNTGAGRVSATKTALSTEPGGLLLALGVITGIGIVVVRLRSRKGSAKRSY
jgi:hypothetical protein